MENNTKLLSLCIPTNGVVDWIIPVIESIYNQDVDKSLFEVIVCDNGDKLDLQEAVKKYDYENFHYYRTNAQGFTNQIEAFEKCNGRFCKMLNHRSQMLSGSIRALIELVEKYKDTKPIIYCAEGHGHGGEIIECKNTDKFVNSLSYWISWSAGTGAWREDIEEIKNKPIDNIFPHTVFLFGIRKESEYVIWNKKYEVMASDAGKGGYDVFYAFGVRLLDIANRLRLDERISDKTFSNFKQELYKFVCGLYLNEVVLPTTHTFVIKNIRQSMMVYYGDYYYHRMVLSSWIKSPIVYLRRLLHKK